jgi:hypothetical protein
MKILKYKGIIIKTIFLILFGQSISIINTMVGVLSTFLTELKAQFSSIQTLINYTFCFIFFQILFSYQQKTFLPWKQTREIQVWKIMLISIVDVLGISI